MVSEGVVDALKSAHRALRDDGVVLDLQPEPGDRPVEVVRGGRVIGSVPQDETWCAGQILRVRERLAGLVEEGYFVAERGLGYEWLQHASTLEEWAAYRAAKGMTPLDDTLVRRLRALVAGGADELVKRERCTAVVLRRGVPSVRA